MIELKAFKTLFFNKSAIFMSEVSILTTDVICHIFRVDYTKITIV